LTYGYHDVVDEPQKQKTPREGDDFTDIGGRKLSLLALEDDV
jgi:hypothetical protein